MSARVAVLQPRLPQACSTAACPLSSELPAKCYTGSWQWPSFWGKQSQAPAAGCERQELPPPPRGWDKMQHPGSLCRIHTSRETCKGIRGVLNETKRVLRICDPSCCVWGGRREWWLLSSILPTAKFLNSLKDARLQWEYSTNSL